jgi:23S rRNA pseudouridine1911/1915/1917 synthase
VAAALVDCRLETGRTHQIRVHLAAIGHPVVGDRDYGGVRSGLSVARPMLHAERLAFVHPGSGERVTFTSPVPADMAAVLARLA